MATLKPELLNALGINAGDGSYLDALSTADQDKLVAMIQQTRQHHHDEIMQAMENTANNVPRVLRGTFRKLFK